MAEGKQLDTGSLNDQEFLESIYQTFKRLMLRSAETYAPEISDREDIVHTAILKLVDYIPTLRALDKPALAAYVICTVRSVGADFIRSQKRDATRSVSIDAQELDEWEAPGEALDDYVASREQAFLLKSIWPELSEDDRMLLEGKYILEHSDTELSEKLDCKASSIRMKLTRARRCALDLMSKRKGGIKNG